MFIEELDKELLLTGEKFGLKGLKLKYNKKYNKYIITFRQYNDNSTVDVISHDAKGIKDPGGYTALCTMKVQIISELMLCGYLKP